MSTRVLAAYETVRTEGAILPADILARIGAGDQSLGGLDPAAYHLAPTEKIGEATNRAWNRLQAAWANFQAAREKLPESDAGTTITRERLLLPLFQLLDYGRLQIAKAEEIGGKSYAISHAWQQTPIHLVGCNVDLDTRIQTAAGGLRSSPHSLLQELLNRGDSHLWGVLSNGLRLRLLRDNVSLTRQAFVEFDLEAMMSGEAYSDFVLLWLLLHQSRFEAERPELCQLEKWSQAARCEGVRVLEGLRDGVQKAIEALGQGFLAHPGNTALREKLRSGALDKQDYYRQLLRLVYRLIFLFVAEDRDLLLIPTTDPVAQKRYRDYYATTRLRRLAAVRAGSRHSDLYSALRLVMDKLSGDGCPELALPALGSFLFSICSLPDLNACELANLHLLDAIRSLAVTQTGGSRRTVDYKNLGAEELGSVYESLLELHPELNAEIAIFELKVASGSERKKTGSYYTPTSLISCLLDSALNPVLDEAARKPEPEAAILRLKVVDPACGSGHFLIAAAHRIAKRLATVRTGEEEAPPEAQRRALRQVISHCIYGVDLNPMAVELCKVSLWMEALEPGKPLSFLEHRIQAGNSLLGATPRLLAAGIPDDAFIPIEGDDKEICNHFKRVNRDEHNQQARLFRATTEPWQQLGNFAASLMNLDTVNDDSIEAVREKERMYENAVRSGDYLDGRLLADAWCAAFVWKKTRAFNYPITEEVFRRIERNPHAIDEWMRVEIERLAAQYRFFHWHLAFPDVFHVPMAVGDPDNGLTAWTGGFDAVLGNPPWVRQELLKSVKPLLGCFRTFCSTVDSSVLFLERAVQISSPGRYIGLLTPNKWFRAAYGGRLRVFLREHTRVQVLIDFGHSHDLFPEQDTFPAAITLSPVRQCVSDDVHLRFVRAHDSDRKTCSLDKLVAERAIIVRHGDLRAGRWQLEGAQESSLLDRLMKAGQTVNSYLGSVPLSGLKTGFNEAYYITTETRNRLVSEDTTCEPLIKRFLRGRDIKRWASVWADQWHIVIRSSQNQEWPWSNAQDENEAETIFASTYPSLHDHLKSFEEQLRKRTDSGIYWWELRACDNYRELESPKLVVQSIAFHSRFALNQTGEYLNDTVVFFPTQDLFLLAVLNSRPMWWLINKAFQRVKDGGVKIQPQFLESLPVPSAPLNLRTEICELVRQLIDGSTSVQIETELRLNRLVEDAFRLTEDERLVMETSLPPRDPIVTLTASATASVVEHE